MNYIIIYYPHGGTPKVVYESVIKAKAIERYQLIIKNISYYIFKNEANEHGRVGHVKLVKSKLLKRNMVK